MQPEFEAILASDLPELEKLVQAYQFILNQHLNYSQHEQELLRAIGNQEALVKEQIKASTLAYTQNVLAFCYMSVTGKKLPNA